MANIKGKSFERFIVEPGTRFNMLTVVKETTPFIQPGGQKQRAFICLCDCGNYTKVRLSHLNHNRVKSCGCNGREIKKPHDKRIWNSYRGMKNRCYNSTYIDFHLYGGKGVKMCNDWLNSFNSFLDWSIKNGYSSDLVIDRINGDGDYCPENCRWVTPRVNTLNRKETFYVNYLGVNMPLKIAVEITNKQDHEPAIRSRIKRGWNHTKAIDTPIRNGNYYTKEKKKVEFKTA
jgi:hypothetical protein